MSESVSGCLGQLLICKLNNSTKALKVRAPSKRFTLIHEVFECKTSVGDYNILRDPSGRLVGFAVDGAQSEIITLIRILGGNSRLEITPNLIGAGFHLAFLLAPCREWMEDSLQASTRVYEGNRG